MSYLRDDIYICPECGQFFDCLSDVLVEVPYSEMPADFAIEVMSIRKKPSACRHKVRRSKKSKPGKGKGFSVNG